MYIIRPVSHITVIVPAVPAVVSKAEYVLYYFGNYQVYIYILMGIVPSLIGSVYVYMYAVDNPKRQEEAMNTGSQSPSSFRLVSWFILRADRDTGPTA